MNLRRHSRTVPLAVDLHRACGVPWALTVDASDHRPWLRMAVIAALAVHASLLLVPRPDPAVHDGSRSRQTAKIHVCKQVKFAQPARVQALPRPSARRCMIPDPTPDEPQPLVLQRWAPGFDTTTHPAIIDTTWVQTTAEPVSTFSIDVDSASAALVRRYLEGGHLPPPGAVRTEEMVNAFAYDDTPPSGSEPCAIHLALSACPWQPEHFLARVAVKGREVAPDQRPPANLVFLVDVSGSMADHDKLPLVRRGLVALVEEGLRRDDSVGIVVYAGAAGVALPPSSGAERGAITAAIARLESGGNTNGAAGIQGAYALARQGWVEGGINRVILVTDGDFNVGVTSSDELVRLIQDEARSGVFLTVLGVGQGNLKDDRLEALADRGNGNYAYLDSYAEARRVLVEQVGGTLHTIAKDVKIQVELNPAEVAAYRLLGYENRRLARQDFNDDRVDAGDLGAGHSVVALYEIVPADASSPAVVADALRYQSPALSHAAGSGELLTVKLRYKEPDGDTSQLLERRLHRADHGPMSADFSFAAGLALFAMELRDSDLRGQGTLDDVARLVALGSDRGQPHRAEVADLVERARPLLAARDASAHRMR